MHDPSNPLGWAVWRRGAVLGLQWLAVFFASTVGSYLLLGITGWSGVLRALCAMGLGPFIALGVIAAWWIIRRPALGPEDTTNPNDTA